MAELVLPRNGFVIATHADPLPRIHDGTRMVTGSFSTSVSDSVMAWTLVIEPRRPSTPAMAEVAAPRSVKDWFISCLDIVNFFGFGARRFARSGVNGHHFSHWMHN